MCLLRRVASRGDHANVPAAEAELLKEVAYYSEAREGTGVKFQAAVAVVVDKVIRNPKGGTPGPKGTPVPPRKGVSIQRRVPSKRRRTVGSGGGPSQKKPEYWAARVK